MKKATAVLLILTLLVSILPVAALAESKAVYLYLRPENFEQSLGTWTMGRGVGGYLDSNLEGGYDNDPNTKISAAADVALPVQGTYFVWVRARDYAANAPGSRNFKVQVGDTVMPQLLGTHGKEGFYWQLAGKLELSKGVVTVGIVDASAHYARMDMVCLTTDETYVPPDGEEEIAQALKNFQLSPSATINQSGAERPAPSAGTTAEPGSGVYVPSKEDVIYNIAAKGEGITLTGTWNESDAVKNFDNGTHLWAYGPGNTIEIALKNLPQAGNYEVYYWAAVHERSTDQMMLQILHKGQTTTAGPVNLQSGTPGWISLGVYDFAADGTEQIIHEATDRGNTRATAVLLAPTTKAATAVTPSPAPSASAAPSVPLKKDQLYYVLRPDHFAGHMGGWSLVKEADCYDGSYLLANTDGIKVPDAQTEINFPSDDIYYVWARTRDYDTKTGTRNFQIKIGDQLLSSTLGKHGSNGWAWELAGAYPSFAGKKLLSLVDTATYGRVDMILVTTDETYQPSNQDLDVYQKNCYYDPEKFPIAPSEAQTGRPDAEVAVKLNGEFLTFDVDPVIENDRTLVPFRMIFEKLGCSVSWDDENEVAIGERNGKVIKIPLNSNTAYADGKAVELDQSAILREDRTLVPLRFVSEALDAAVNWEEQTQTVSILAVIPPAAFFLRPDSFVDLGTWKVSEEGNAFDATTLYGASPTAPPNGAATPENADVSKLKPAKTYIMVSRPGQYRVWAHGRDYAANQPGTRYFGVAVNGQDAGKKFGTHGGEGFRWQDAGIFELKEGLNTIEVVDSSGFYARCDGLFITQDLVNTPPESYGALAAIAPPYSMLTEANMSPDFPVWARSDKTPTAETTIESPDSKVIFYTVPTAKGEVIQNEIYTKSGGKWYLVKERSEDLGYLMLKAIHSNPASWKKEFVIFSQKLELSGMEVDASTTNIYKTGVPTWLVPRSIEKVGDNKVVLGFGNHPDADVSVSWEYDEKTKDPLVTLNAVFHTDGAYTFGFFNGKEYKDSEYSFALAPFRIHGKQVVEGQGVIPEHYMFTPMGTITLPQTNGLVPGEYVTKGVAVEPSYTKYDWTYRETSDFGFSMRGVNHGVRGNLFAPLFGNEKSNFQAGETFTFAYRPINQVADWFSAYKYIAGDLYEVDDYRQNYYTSFNEAIFNTRDLMMDDVSGGWDEKAMGHYNMESRNTASIGNPMTAIQEYLLTEDQEILNRRAIPTLASFLTRENLHFAFQTPAGNYVTGAPTSIGSPIAGFNLNVLGGMYEMTRGQVPYLLEYGIQKAETGGVINSYGNIPSFTNDIWLYKYTGDKKYYDSAVQKADEYLETNVWKETTEPPEWSTFIFISYYANLASLLDLYEMTGEQKYLEAASETGKWLSTCVWAAGIDGTKKTDLITIEPEKVKQRPYMQQSSTFWWHGDAQWRLGSPDGVPGIPQNIDSLTPETVPGWVPQRTGLGIEQASTFNEGLNMVMCAWAGDMAKLSEYTGEAYFDTVARNAMIGRFGNYSGYYQNRIMTLQQKPEYPYVGPDFTSIYWHHIPPFLSMLEDFLINETFNWSGGNISFPAVRQQGYAYFNSNQYGFAPGRFFDEEQMWLWLDRGIVEVDSINADWIAAKKDGVLGLSFLNNLPEENTVTIKLGEKVPGGEGYTGEAMMYGADGTKSPVEIQNGSFTVTLPPKTLRAFVIKIAGIKAPAYAQAEYDYTTDLKSTVADHQNGRAYALQLTPEQYHAYVYITNKPDQVTKLTMKYKIGDGAEQTVTCTQYPFEFLIPVSDASKEFTYTLTAEGTAGFTTSGKIAPANQ